MKRKAFITGGTGFIGRALVARLLELGWQVCVIARDMGSPDSELGPVVSTHILPAGEAQFTGQALYNLLADIRPDAIFHLAAMQPKEHDLAEISDLLATNVGLGAYLLEGASSLGGIPFINVGSYWQYYGGNETDPVNLYAATKSAFQELAKYYANVRNDPIVNLILVDTYGESDSRGKILTTLINSALNGQPVDLSPGGQELDYIHVDDVVEGMIHAAIGLGRGTLQFGTYALHTGINYSLRSVAHIVADVTGHPVPVNWGRRPYAPRQIMRVHIPHPTLPGWEAHIDLPSGIARLHHAHLATGKCDDQ